MDFSYTKQQVEIMKAIKVLAKKGLNDQVFEDDETERFPIEKWKKICELGILELPIEHKYNGLGESITTTALAIKTLAAHCMDEGLVFSLCAHLCTCLIPIYLFGNEKQKEKYLPGLMKGDLIGGNGTSEADAGSDLSLIETKIEKSGEDYCLKGAKIFVTNASIADVLIIYARHNDGAKNANLSAFIVEKGIQGLSLGQKWNKMGLRTSPMSEIILDDCRLTKDCLLGRERFGLALFSKSMLWERVLMAAYHIGAMELQYNTAFSYATKRKQFDTRIINFQGVSDKLVKMRMNIETANLLLYKTCWKFDNDTMSVANASMLKLFTSESKVENSLDAVQIFGGYGFMKEFLVEKQLRDSIGAKIYSGTSEIQKKLIIEDIGEIDE